MIFSDKFQQSIVFSLFFFDLWIFLLCCKNRYPLCHLLRPGAVLAGYAGDNALRAVFSSLVRRPKMLGIMAGMDQKDSCSGMYKAGIAGDNTLRAVFVSLVGRPMMVDIVAVMDQKDSCDMVPMFRLLMLWSLRSCSPSRSSTSLSRCRGSLSWSKLFV